MSTNSPHHRRSDSGSTWGSQQLRALAATAHSLNSIDENGEIEFDDVPSTIGVPAPATKRKKRDDDSAMSSVQALYNDYLPLLVKSKDVPKNFDPVELDLVNTERKENLPTLKKLMDEIRNHPRKSIVLQMGKTRIDSSRGELVTKNSLWRSELKQAEKTRDACLQQLPGLRKEHKKKGKELRKASKVFQGLDRDLAAMTNDLSLSTAKAVATKKKMAVADLILGVMDIVAWDDHCPFQGPPSSNEEDDDDDDDVDEDDMVYSTDEEDKQDKKPKLPEFLAVAAEYAELSEDDLLQVVKDRLDLHSFKDCTKLVRAEVLGVLHILDCFAFHKSKFFRGLFRVPPDQMDRFDFSNAYSSDSIDTGKGTNVSLALQKRVAHYLGFSTTPELTEGELVEQIEALNAVTAVYKNRLTEMRK